MLKLREKNKLLNYFGQVHGVNKLVAVIYFILLIATAALAVLCSGEKPILPSQYRIYALIGLCVLAVPLVFYFLNKIRISMGRVNDKELDKQYLNLIKPDEIIALAKEKFGFTKDQRFVIPPVVFHNYADEDSQTDLVTPFMKKRGMDGLLRSTHILCLAYFFGEDIMFQFGYAVDICGEVRVTVCDDIYYSDISKNIKVTTITTAVRDENGDEAHVVLEKIVLSTKSHGEIRIPFFSTPSQTESFNKMRRHIRAINAKKPPISLEE